MIQFNLLPDVKLALIKAKRTEHLAMSISTIVIIVCVIALIVMFGVVDGWQKHSLSNANASISSSEAKIKSTPSLNKILTIQNQLESLPSLENQKPAATRLFDYISQVTPQEVNLSQLQVDFTKHTLEFTGTADNLSTVDEFVDTLKFTTYSVSGSKDNKPAFSDVVLSSFGRNSDNANFDVTTDFDPTIFDEADNITKLNVPNEVTTRSELEQPKILFNGPDGGTSGGTSTTTNNSTPPLSNPTTPAGNDNTNAGKTQ